MQYLRVFLGTAFLCSLGCSTVQKKQKATVSAESSTPLFVPDDLEVSVWATSPMFYNPTNMDVDVKGRIWITEAVNYRDFKNVDDHLKHPEGDRVMILEDTDGDGVADSSKEFVHDKDLVAPLGIAVVGNKVFVSCSPSIIVYTDDDGDDKPDRKEVFLTGFGGKDHDHGLHSGVAGPDGKLYFNTGNQGPHIITDKAGWTLRSGSVIIGGSPYALENTPGLKSDDGKIYTGGFLFRVNPDGTGLEVMAHNFRNSYEVFMDSFGDFWQNDNDDQIATCRTTWLMEGANAGYLSNTGERTQQADRRPGQSVPTAQWHQEDPGILPAGDIYGSGSPTGVVVNEGDALGKHYRGLLLSADAGRNIIFGYMPELQGAGYGLSEKNRQNFISSVDRDNKNYRWTVVEEDKNKWFRPCDVTIGTDGAIYVADFYDPIVGGHQMLDKEGYGRIYRIVPKGKKLNAPVINLKKTKGQIAALLSPAINVRSQGFERLKAAGKKAFPAVKEVLKDENPYHRARAVWLLSQMGEAGIKEVEALLGDPDFKIRTTALRALRQANVAKVVDYARQLAADPSAAVRREVAISLRNVPLEKSQPVLLTLIDGYDGQDAWYLNALGIALKDKEAAFYPALRKHFNAADPVNWSPALSNLVWELHPPAAVAGLLKRAQSEGLSAEERKKAMVALAFIPSREAALAMLKLVVAEDEEVAAEASYWLQFRKTNDWKAYLQDWTAPEEEQPEAYPELLALSGTVANSKIDMGKRLAAAAELAKSKEGVLHLIRVEQGLPAGIFQSVHKEVLGIDDRYLRPLILKYFGQAADVVTYEAKSVAKLTGNTLKGKALLYSNCIMCHKMEEMGGEIGPVLTNISGKYDKSALIDAIVRPNAGIEFGSEAYLVSLKNGAVVYGVLLSNGPVVTIQDVYNRRYMIEDAQIISKKRLRNSPMPSPADLKLGEQEVADITAYLMSYGKK